MVESNKQCHNFLDEDMIRQLLSTVFQVAGFGAILVGVALWSIPAALIVAGVLLTLTGFALGIDK